MAITNRQHYTLSQSDDEDSLFPVRKSSRRFVFFSVVNVSVFTLNLRFFTARLLSECGRNRVNTDCNKAVGLR